MFGSISELFWLSELHRSFLACRSESLVKHKRVVLFWTSLCFQRVSSLILAQYRSYPISWSQHHSYFRHFEFIHLCWSCVKNKGQMHPRALQIDFEKSLSDLSQKKGMFQAICTCHFISIYNNNNWDKSSAFIVIFYETVHGRFSLWWGKHTFIVATKIHWYSV